MNNLKLLRTSLFIIFLFINNQINAQHTFSIVAVDPSTGEIGSAGATCLDIDDLNGEEGALVISDIILGIGAINSQAAYNPNTQAQARSLMLAGNSPSEILLQLSNNDGNYESRQYGIVDLIEGSARSSAHTGNNNPNIQGHRLGTNFAVQGNTLISQEVLDDMRDGFNNTTGSLADKLMGAMQGAKRIGADNRCTSNGTSSKSAFLRVATPEDLFSDYGHLTIDLNVSKTSQNIDPIDILQNTYNLYQNTLNVNCENIISTFPYTESFESGLGLWFQNDSSLSHVNNTDFDWTSNSLETMTANTGPTSAIHGSDYLYTEASGANIGYPTKRAVLESPCFDLTNATEAIFRFNYHMFGTDIGNLAIRINNGSGWKTIWLERGNKGNQWNSATIDLSSYIGDIVKLQLDSSTGLGFRSDAAIDNLKLEVVENSSINYIFNNSSWSPNSPDLVDNPSTNIDNIEIVSGNPTFTNEVIANNVTISTGSTLDLGNATLSISGNLINNGSLNADTGTLLLNGTSDQTISGNAIALNNFNVASNSTKTLQTPVSISGTMNLSNGVLNTNNQLSFLNTYDELGQTHTNGMLDEVTGGSIVGNVLVQRYFPAKRAYRLVASPVTTTTTIRENWQTDGNVVQGFGTHITGAGGATNGFDATGTNNPSIFTLNTVGQNYEVLANTNANTLSVGNAYLLMVRGDRTIDLTDNNATPSNTILETIGELHIGNFNSPNISTVENGSSLIANPYQASVDMALVLQNTTNLNQRYYHVYDPTINSRGAFVTVDTQENTNSLTFGTGISLSSANKFLQPSQAAFVNTVTNGAAALQFTEGFKDLSGNGTNVFFAELEQQSIGVALYNGEDELKDGTRIIFSEEDTNAVTQLDAIKNPNLDENISTKIEDQEFSIQRRAFAIAEDEIELSITNYREDNYKFKFQFKDLEPSTLVSLYDVYLNTQTPLNINGETIVNFNVNETNASRASDRFKLVFQTNVLGANDINLNSSITISPNPASQFILISNPQSIGINSIVIYDLMGKQVIKRTNGLNKIDISKLESAFYLVEINSTLGSFQKRLIVK